MAQLLTSLENETELKAIGRNNNFFEKKCSTFERQKKEIERSIQLLDSCNSQVKRMSFISKEKRLSLKADVEKGQQKIHKFVHKSTTLLNSSFEKVDLTRGSNHLSHRLGTPALSITLPYDNCIQKCTKVEEKLRLNLVEISKSDGLLTSEKENLEKLQQITLKSRGKAEKDIMKLKEEIQVQENVVSTLQKSSFENQKKLLEAKDEVSMETEKKMNVELEMKSAEQTRDDLLQKLASSKSVQMTEEILAALDEFHSDLNTDTNIDPTSVSQLGDFEEILHLFNEWQTLKTENSVFSQSVENSGSEYFISLEASLENVKKETRAVLKNIEQIKDYNERLVITNELLSRKKSGIEAVKKQIAENTTVLDRLKVTEHAAKPSDSVKRQHSQVQEIFRTLEATRNDVPEPEPYKPYQTPSRDVPNPSAASRNVDAKTMKRESIGSGSTRNMSTSGSQYPGIKIIGKHNTDNASIPRGVNEDASFLEEFDSLADDTGTTQDESMLNQVFGPLGNQKPDSPPEFSMVKHFDEFSQRQEKIKASQVNVRNIDNVQNQYSNTNDGEVGDDEDDKDNSLFAPPNRDLNDSAIDSEEDDDDQESEEIDDVEDDLLVPDDQEDLDQSAWGSDD